MKQTKKDMIAVTGKSLFIFLQERFKMTREQSLQCMIDNGQDISFIKNEKSLNHFIN
tara:strand:- start:249 stop:419 length:171 start_codon:yes stop_codon:yes gene_type:complete